MNAKMLVCYNYKWTRAMCFEVGRHHMDMYTHVIYQVFPTTSQLSYKDNHLPGQYFPGQNFSFMLCLLYQINLLLILKGNLRYHYDTSQLYFYLLCWKQKKSISYLLDDIKITAVSFHKAGKTDISNMLTSEKEDETVSYACKQTRLTLSISNIAE